MPGRAPRPREHHGLPGEDRPARPGRARHDLLHRLHVEARHGRGDDAARRRGKLVLDEPVDRLVELAHRKVLKRLDTCSTTPCRPHAPSACAIHFTFASAFPHHLASGTYPIQKAADDLVLGQGMPAPAAPPAPDEWLRSSARCRLCTSRASALDVQHGRGRAAQPAGAPAPAAWMFCAALVRSCPPHDTDFSVLAALARFVTSYLVASWTSGKLVLYDAVDGQWSKPPAFPSGAAGLVSTVPDFLRFSARSWPAARRAASGCSRPDAGADDDRRAAHARQQISARFVPGYFDQHAGASAWLSPAQDDLGHPPGAYEAGTAGSARLARRSAHAERRHLAHAARVQRSAPAAGVSRLLAGRVRGRLSGLHGATRAQRGLSTTTVTPRLLGTRRFQSAVIER